MIILPKFSLEQIDKGLYEAIRKEIVRQGYLPDILTYPTDSAFNAQRNIIETSGKKIIELFPVGFQQAKQELKFNSIYIERKGDEKGDFSTSSVTDFIEVEGSSPKTYDKVILPDYPVNISYSLTIYTDTIHYERILYGIIKKALGQRKYLVGVNPDRSITDNKFWLFYNGNTDTSGADFIEKQYRYKAMDIMIDESEFLYNVPETTEINIEFKTSKEQTEFELDTIPKIELNI